MLIGSRQKLNALTASPVLSISGTPVNQVSTSKSLGVLIDKNLNWGSHIEKLAKKIASGIAAIKRVRQFVPPATLHLIYKALIQPHLDYCKVVWGICGIKLADKLQKLQNRASRALTFSSYDADALQLFQNLNWKNLSTLRDIQKALMGFKSLNGLAPEYLSSKFIAWSKTTSYSFRDCVTWDQAQFSFRFVNNIQPGKAKRKQSLIQTFYETSAAHFFDWLSFAESANQNYFRSLSFLVCKFSIPGKNADSLT